MQNSTPRRSVAGMEETNHFKAVREAQPCASTTSRSTTACCEDWSKGYRGNNAPDHVNVFMRKKDSTNVVTIWFYDAYLWNKVADKTIGE